MYFNFINAGIEVPMNSEGYVSVVYFSWDNNQKHKLFWNCTKDEAIEKFKSFASVFNGRIEQDIYVWHCLTDSEFFIKTRNQPDAHFALRSLIFEMLTNSEPEKLNALISLFEIND